MQYPDRIIVVDSYMGKGKTSWAIQHIKELPEDMKVIYITPFLTEVERIISSCPEKEFRQPNFKRGKGKKMNDLIKLVLSGENIVSTHALFSNTDDELIEALRANDYVLFLDEVFQTVEKYNIIDTDRHSEEIDMTTKQDVETLLAKGLIKVEDDFRVSWVDSENHLSRYTNLINLANKELLYFVHGSLLMWTFPIEVFREGIFAQIFILTHRFESQLQSYYYHYFKLEYKKYAVYPKDNKYEIRQCDYDEDEKEWKKEVKKKIHVLENQKMNKLGDVYYDVRNHPHKTSLSKTWYEKNPDLIKIIQNNLTNYFTNIVKSKSTERLWTSFKDDINRIKSKNVTKRQWLACNAKATNDYGDKTTLAYLINRYVDTFYDDFFQVRGISVNQDEYALSEMLQWIWRSAIRNGGEVYIYIPSMRMRRLLEQYLNDESIGF